MADQAEASDERLIQSAQQGSLEAFTLLYERYLPMVYNRVRYVVPEQDVEDVVQEIFIAVMKSLPSFKGQSKFSTWLRTLTKRRVADFYRKRRLDEEPSSMNLSDSGEFLLPAFGEKPNITLDEKIMLRRAMCRLPEQYQDVLLMRFAEGLKFREIALLQDRSLEATKSMFRRAINALRTEMGVTDG